MARLDVLAISCGTFICSDDFYWVKDMAAMAEAGAEA
jgi:hypothetical protein